MNINEIKLQHRNQWILVRVLKEDDAFQPLEGEVLKFSENRDQIYDALLETAPGSRVAVLFSGNPLSEGYAAVFVVD